MHILKIKVSQLKILCLCLLLSHLRRTSPLKQIARSCHLLLCSFLSGSGAVGGWWYSAPYPKPKPSSFMWGSKSCWDLGVVSCFLICLSEVSCITCFDYPTSFFPLKRTSVRLGGLCRYWTVRAELATIIKLVQYEAVWNRCLILIYTIVKVLTLVAPTASFPP